MGFPVVPHKDGVFGHHLDVHPFPSNFILPSVPGPFFWDYEELGRSREVLYVFKIDIVEFICLICQVQDENDYPHGINDPPNAIDFCLIPLF